MNGKMVTRGKGYEGCTLHELRHTQATLLQGVVSPKAAQHRLGHSQISMAMNTYAHFLDAEDIAVAEAMDSILNAPLLLQITFWRRFLHKYATFSKFVAFFIVGWGMSCYYSQ